jgi:hypothetical protein
MVFLPDCRLYFSGNINWGYFDRVDVTMADVFQFRLGIRAPVEYMQGQESTIWEFGSIHIKSEMKADLNKRKLFGVIILTGLLTGTMDIFLAFLINYQIPPSSVLRYIASGVMGTDAFPGGSKMAIIGLLIHFGFAFF